VRLRFADPVPTPTGFAEIVGDDFPVILWFSSPLRRIIAISGAHVDPKMPFATYLNVIEAHEHAGEFREP
jgi:hypothetical protein